MNGCNVFFNRRCSSARERVLSLWEEMSHEGCQKWKCSFSFQQMQLSLIVLLKMSHCSFSAIFAHIPSGRLCHLLQSSAHASCCNWVFNEKKGLEKDVLALFPPPIWNCLIHTYKDCLHIYMNATFEHKRYKKSWTTCYSGYPSYRRNLK